MHHFTRLSHKHLLALCLSTVLIMGSLSGCGSQGSAATDTIAEPAVSATVGTTDNTAFPLPEGSGGVYHFCRAGGRHFR